jgi:hydrogenase maturation factor
MEFENKEARTLFFHYAAPCAKVFVKRGIMNKEYFNNLINAVVKGEIPPGTEQKFELALRMCDNVAQKLHRRKIDEEVVREYFWIVHDKVARQRYEKMHDFDLDECIVYPGKVLSDLVNKKALISTPIKNVNYRCDFVPELEKGDNVTVHYDYIAEIISEKDAKMLWGLKGKK